MSARWEKGIWLGKRFTSEEHILGTADGMIVRSAAVKAHPEVEWDSGLFDLVKGSPWDPEGKHGDRPSQEAPEHVEDLPRVVVPRGADDPVPVPRRALISRDMLDRFGFTPGCLKCKDIESG